MSRCQFNIFLCVLVVGMRTGNASRADDFSVNIKNLVEMDPIRPMPEYKLERVLREEKPDPEMPSKKFDVFIRFTEFGSVRLDNSWEDGPSSGKFCEKGRTFTGGLNDLEGVKCTWIKNSPDLFIVAWFDEPDSRGTGYSGYFRHALSIVQLHHRQADVLLRGRCSICAKNRGGIQDGVIDYSHFSFNAKEGILQERLTRDYEIWSRESDPHIALTHQEKRGEDDDILFVARIRETIALEYKLADGKLQPCKASLVYHARRDEQLSEIARFYLGPFAPKNVVRDVNSNLTMKYKVDRFGEFVHLDEGTEIKVPVPDKWLIDRFARTEVDKSYD
jgi:hypothetical protein